MAKHPDGLCKRVEILDDTLTRNKNRLRKLYNEQSYYILGFIIVKFSGFVQATR
jgi:hypothetical protein